MTRREFLRRLEAMSAAAVAGASAIPFSGCLGFYYVDSTLVGSRVMVRRSEFGANPFVLVDAPSESLPIFVIRDDDGSYTALSTRCMHRGCQVEPAGGRLVCPCHGSEYTTGGAVLKGPTERPLRRFPVSVEGDAIAIELGGPAR